MTPPPLARRWVALLLTSLLVLGAGLVLLTRTAVSPGRWQAAPPDSSLHPETSSPPRALAASPSRSGPTPMKSSVARSGSPQRLRLDRLGIDLAIDPVGVDATGDMALPESTRRMGWYRYGPAPGDSEGSAVVAGHVDSRSEGVGPLARLAAARPGDDVTIVFGERTLRFEVTELEMMSRSALSKAGIFARDGAPVLRVITCGGQYIPAQGGYQDNLVVTAVAR